MARPIAQSAGNTLRRFTHIDPLSVFFASKYLYFSIKTSTNIYGDTMHQNPEKNIFQFRGLTPKIWGPNEPPSPHTPIFMPGAALHYPHILPITKTQKN
jgi:hypothetical protein